MSVEVAVSKALVDRLKAQLGAGATGGRVFDRVEPSAAFPYIAIGELQAVKDAADCVDGFEVFIRLDVWSSSPGKKEAATIAGTVRDALDDFDLVLADPYAMLEIEHRDTVSEDAGDGLASRARVSFRALVERIS